ncbi:MAG: NUDIX hydrolase [Acidimicrobiales bacterium]
MPPPEHAAAAGDPGRDFRQTGEEVLFSGWRISVVGRNFEAPDGTSFHRDIVRHPGAVAVVPVTDRGTALLVRQFRGSLGRWLLELPAGVRDVDGEPPEQTAARELEEEAGYAAGTVEYLATIANSPGFCDQLTMLYVATDLRETAPAREGQEEQFIEVVEVPFADVDGLVARGEIIDAETVLGLLLARDRLAG